VSTCESGKWRLVVQSLDQEKNERVSLRNVLLVVDAETSSYQVIFVEILIRYQQMCSILHAILFMVPFRSLLETKVG
jgi:hypothetical protein